MGARAESQIPEPGRRRGWWLRDALAAEGDPAPAPPLRGDEHADVAIIGGGYTGMWTAYFLAKRAPGTRIVLLEQDICGGGPSGRNGGFVHGWWEDLPYLVDRYGREAGLEIARQADEVVDGIGAWCAEHDVDAGFTKAGYLTVNAFPGRPSAWGPRVARLWELGAAEHLQPLSPAEVQRVCASPAFGDGLLMPSAASIQPARLARGLRRVLLEQGVVIHEGTSVHGLRGRDGRVRVETLAGSVTTDQAVLAVNAWAAGWPGFRSRVLAWGSYMVMTEPIPRQLDEIGWTGGELLSDDRYTISYFRTTADGRIAFGAGVGAAGFGGRIGPVFTHDRRAVRRVVANLDHLLPMLREVRLEDAWGGPIDITGDRMPEIGSTQRGRLHFAHGFRRERCRAIALRGPYPRRAGRPAGRPTGTPADRRPADSRCCRRSRSASRAARLVREALIRQDDAYDAGRRPSRVLDAIGRLPSLLGYRIGR